LAASICASTSAIGFGVGLGVRVGRAVAVGTIEGLGAALAPSVPTVGGDVYVKTRPGIASHATQRTSSNAANALIVLG